MFKRFATLGLIAVLFATGCATATSYQSRGFTGGFDDTTLGPGIYRVSFQGNAFTPVERVQDFVLLRSAELAARHGFTHFVVSDAQDSSTKGAMVLPGRTTTRTTGSAQVHGNNVYGSATSVSTTSPDTVMPYVKPGQILVVHANNEGERFDVQFLLHSIRSKYEIAAD